MEITIEIVSLWKLLINFNRCRHKTFAEYFGEETPRCTMRCDACTDARAVRRALEQHMRRAMSATLQRAGFVSHDDSSELYGQGRDGQKR